MFTIVSAFMAFYTVCLRISLLLSSDWAGITVFIAADIIDNLFQDGILAVGVFLVVYEILAAQASPGGIVFALLARNEDIHIAKYEADSDTANDLSFESASDVTLVAAAKPVPVFAQAVLTSIGLSATSIELLLVSSRDDILATSAPKAASSIPLPAALQKPFSSVSRRLVSKLPGQPASSYTNKWLISLDKTPWARTPEIPSQSQSALKVVDVDMLDAVFDKWQNDDTRGLHTSQHAPTTPSLSPPHGSSISAVAVSGHRSPVAAAISPSSPQIATRKATLPPISAVAVSGHRSAGTTATSPSSPQIATRKATPPPVQAPVLVPATTSGSSALEARLTIKADALLLAITLPEAPDLTLETEWTPTVLVWQAPRRPTGRDYDGVGASRWSDARMHMRVDDLDTIMADDAESADVTMDEAEDFGLDFLMNDVQDLDITMDDVKDIDTGMYDVKDLDTIIDDVNDIDTIMYEANDADAIMADDDASPT